MRQKKLYLCKYYFEFMDKTKLSDTLSNSPSVELLKTKNREFILLTIQNDFSNFDPKGNWKKLLDKKYNSNSTKKRIE